MLYEIKGFAMIFIAEYGRILFLRILSGIILDLKQQLETDICADKVNNP